MNAQTKAMLTTAVIVIAVLVVLSKFTDQSVCDNFGLTSHKGA